MIFELTATYSKLNECFYFYGCKHESVEDTCTQIVRSLKVTPKAELAKYKDMQFVHIGTFDDVTGVVTPCNKVMLDFNQYLPSDIGSVIDEE